MRVTATTSTPEAPQRAAPQATTSRWAAAAAGILSVGLALGVGELLAAMLPGVPSLVTAVGAVVIPFVPPALERFAIATFGTADKLVLNASTVVITLAIGAYAGIAARRHFGSAVSLFVTFALVGAVATLLQALVNPLLALGALVVATGSGLLALRALVARLPRRAASATAPAEGTPLSRDDAMLSRRRFLAVAAGVGAAAVVTAATGRMIQHNRTAAVDLQTLALPEPVRALPPPRPANAFEDVTGLTPIIVPNDDFYRIDTALAIPRIDPATWRLRVHGMVDREVELTYDQLLGLPLVEAYITLACVSNPVGGDLVGNAKWTGVRLADVLDRAGVRADATQIVGRSIDGFTTGFPTAAAFDGRDALVAVGMNGEPLPPVHGFPARLVVPGLYGYVSATKWLSDIELATWEAFDAYWVPRGWSKEGPVKTQSRIDVPAAGGTVAAGDVVVAGVAWAPTVGIRSVEVRLDSGQWVPATLTDPLSEAAWVQWRATVSLPAGRHYLEVRATDDTGLTQPAEYVPPAPSGAEGHHVIRVEATRA